MVLLSDPTKVDQFRGVNARRLDVSYLILYFRVLVLAS